MRDERERRTIIEPKVLKGFRDFLPSMEIPKKAIINKLEAHFSLYGFVPIDTPVLEYTEVLLGKGGGETDKQIFHFLDNGERDVALRFDLTVPFARFLAQHQNELSLPFKRFHIDKVWRGENPQKGRFREFTQCDFDIVGTDSAEADYEILSMMESSFSVMGITDFQFCIAHRGLFNAFLAHLEVEEKSVEILRCVDKLRKIGEQEVVSLLHEITSSQKKAEMIVQYITKENPDESFLTTLERLSTLAGNETEHTSRMRTIYAYLQEAGIETHFTLDPSITRGLDYYTGIVYETFLTKLPHFGSVCSGGRYNDLASLYTKEKLPGVGSSIGLDRLLAALEELDSPLIKKASSSDLIIFCQDATLRSWYDQLARTFRARKIRTDVYLLDKKMAAQFKYAEANHIPFGLSCGKEEREAGKVSLKNLETRQSHPMISIEEAIAIITKELF
ncbi:histidine--tRNA ligase [Sphaerochaeta sp. PS]|uniref:histidine--tRNA ligase n=1 Tax=Sphaerochaeta sp. PS TaxID=3076336 RepID=UPI0028A3B8BD|nr:histidine--tRNA ligase [Sphaerochaeta sp. PS]MDT4761413.1 histidine--tRNA ligase [Sphaerochaeta sp. PS]